MKVFSIYDSKAEVFCNPFYEITRGVAIRAFTQAANDPQHQFNLHAADYTLFEIGEWDDKQGNVMMYEAKQNLGTALEYMQGATPDIPALSAIQGGE